VSNTQNGLLQGGSFLLHCSNLFAVNNSMKTKDKIVHESLKLFNQRGERAVTTNHIAEHLGMSPGNLYYHFRNKEDIIKSIFELYIEFISHSIDPPNDKISAQEYLANYCHQVFDSIWKFRFFHASMPSILYRDDELHEQYLAAHHMLEQRAFAAIVHLKIEKFIEIDNDDIAELVELMRLVTGFWVNYCMANTMKGKITKTQVSLGVLKLIRLISPYGTPAGKTVFNQLRTQYEKASNAE